MGVKKIIRLIKVFFLTAKYASKIRKVKLSSKSDPKLLIDQLKTEWAVESLKNLRVQFEVEGHPVVDEPLLFVGNHMSYLDIPLIMAAAPVSFVAKDELSHWPIIGDACKTVGTVFVKRESSDSRKVAVDKIAEACLKGRQSICLFPSGTTSVLEEKPWRRGAFEIAKLKKLKIQPFRINYFPREIVAFVGDDALLPHLWKLIGTNRLMALIEFHKPVTISESEIAAIEWQKWAKEIKPLL